jgi:hypothetical protein
MPVGNPVLQATVAPSGQSIVLLATDSAGDSTNITSLASSSEVQSIRLASAPSGNEFVLSFAGETTSPISTALVPPGTYLLWSFPTIVGHSYSLAATWSYGSSTPIQYDFETIESGTIVAHFLTSDTPPSASDGFADPGVYENDNITPAYWMTITPTNIVASADSMQIRYTASIGGNARMSGIRVQDTTANTITYYNANEPANVTAVPIGGWLLNIQFCYSGYEYATTSQTGIGGPVAIAPGSSTPALSLQNALEALPAIGSGNLTVLDDSGSGNGNYQITFAGNLVNVPQPVITCPDPAIVIAEVSKGGTLIPSLTINGRTPLSLLNWIYDENTPSPYVYLPLPQSSPAVQTAIVGNLPCQPLSGNWNNGIGDSSTLSGLQVFGFASGLTMNFPFTLLAPGTYQFAIAYATSTQVSGGVTCQPYSATQFLILDSSGDTLATYSINQTQNPTDYQSEGQGWKVLGSFTTTQPLSTLELVMNTVGIPAQAGATQYVATLDAVQLTRTSSDTSVVLTAEDALTLTVQDNWVTTAAGVVAAATLSVGGPSAILPEFVVGPKSMKAGMNLEAVGTFYNFVTHSNLSYLMSPYWNGQTDSDGYPMTLYANRDGNGNPILPAYQTLAVISTNANVSIGDPAEGTYVINSGKFVLTWDGDPTCYLQGGSWCSATELDVPKPSNVTGNWKVYDLYFAPGLIGGPNFSFTAESSTPDPSDPSGGTYLINLTNLAIYPPDPSDPTGQTIWGLDTETNIYTPPPKFHPWYLYKLEGMQCLRYLSQTNTNNNACSQLSHFKPVTHADRLNPTNAYYRAQVSQIQAPQGSPYFFLYDQISVFQVTTTEPHGLWDGCGVTFSNCGTAEFPGGSAVLNTNTSGVSGIIHVVDDTNIICVTQLGSGVGNLMTNKLTPASGQLIVNNYGSLWPLQDMVDLVAAVGCSDFWFNMPITMDIAPGGGAYQVAAVLAATVPKGVKIHIECGNECWNFTFPTYAICELKQSVLNQAQTGAYQTYYANQCKAIHDECLAAFTAAGRPGDLVRVFGTQGGNPFNTGPILQQAQTIGARIDELCIATYYSNWPASGFTIDHGPIYNSMTIDQTLDYMELIAVDGGYPAALVADQIPTLQANGYGNTKMTAYEGGASALVVPFGDPNFPLKQNAVKRHPRMYGVTLQMSQGYQDAGLTLWNYFDVGGQTSDACWGLYESGNMRMGTGNPVADAINVTNPQAKNQVLSEMGGGWHYWSTLSGAPSSSSPTPPTPTVLHNGRTRAIGIPRGLSRPTRSH